MTFAGKKLQDIYDSGADRLSDLEVQAISNLKQSKDAHTAKLKTDVEECVGRVKGTASDLKAELGTYIDGGLGRLKTVIEIEMHETKTHTEHLVSELTNLSAKLKGSIEALRRAYADNINFISLSASNQFVASVERAKLDLEKSDYADTRHLKAHGTFIANSLQQKLDHVLWESRGDEKQVTGNLFKSYMQKANAIDSHFSALMQKVSSEFQGHYKSLESAAKKAEIDTDSAAKNILQRVDDHAIKSENQVSEHFKKVSEQHRQKLDADLATVADDLSSIHDATTEKLGKSTGELSESLLGASNNAQETLKVRCDGMKQKINLSMSEFTKRLAERLRTSTDLKTALESDRDDIVGGIRVELAQIQESFEKKVSNLIASASERIKTVAGEAERDINNQKKNLDDQLISEGKTAKKEIDDEVAKFLSILAKHRSSALGEIVSAAGSSEGGSQNIDKRAAKQKRLNAEGSGETRQG